jgi:hypothetical protein
MPQRDQDQPTLLPNLTAVFLAIRRSSSAQHPTLADLQPGEIALIVTVPKERRDRAFYRTVSALVIDGTQISEVFDNEHNVAFRAREPLSREALNNLKSGNVVTMYAETTEGVTVDVSISPPGSDQLLVKSKMFDGCLSDGV